jgi:hypothetical protein
MALTTTPTEIDLATATNATSTKSASERKELLARSVQSHVAQGWRVESAAGDFGAVLAKGHKPNHLMHLVITLLTLGVWLVGWLIRIGMGGEKRTMIAVDEYGNVLPQSL